MSDDLPRPLRALENTRDDQETLTGAEGQPATPAEPLFTGEEDTVRQQPAALLGLAGKPERDPVIGSEVMGYRVKGKLGQGGMGIVYEGEQPVIGKRVAIKVLRPEVADNPDVVQRLVAEARAVNQVGHRGIIDVFGFGQLPDGRQCIVMEYLDGQSLEQLIAKLRAERRIMPLVDVLVILDELLSALGAAHSAGIVHRDLKPSNIFLCSQRDGTKYVKVLDFGIAKLGVVGASPQTNAGQMMGTPSYMAPEQSTGGMVSPALDLYAVGCIAWELLTGQQVFKATTVIEMVMKHRDEKPARPSTKVLSLPDLVDDWVMKLLEKRPEDRYPSADEARKVLAPMKKELLKSSARMPELSAQQPSVALSPSMQLEAVKDALPASALPKPADLGEGVIDTTPPTRASGSPRRSGLVAVVVALGAVIVGAGVVLSTRPSSELAQPAVVTPTRVSDRDSRVARLLERLGQLEGKLGADEAKQAALSSLKLRLAGPPPSADALTALEAQVGELERAAP
ncbi:MAG: serine/threonine protein kinase [Myxococcaceae bacterium]|nr:serine/threonine protein kinase [Myxococcaceae bacterium]